MILTTNFRLHRLARVLDFGIAAAGFAGQASAEEQNPYSTTMDIKPKRGRSIALVLLTTALAAATLVETSAAVVTDVPTGSATASQATEQSPSGNDEDELWIVDHTDFGEEEISNNPLEVPACVTAYFDALDLGTTIEGSVDAFCPYAP